MSGARRIMVLGLAAGLFACAVLLPWPVDASVRRAVGIVLAVLVLWISEVAPLGVIALVVPVAATLSGVLKWGEALAAWGDPIVFLFMGAFLLARALDKHGVFERLGSMAWGRSSAAEGSVSIGAGGSERIGSGSGAGTGAGGGARIGSGGGVGALCMIVLLVSGALSTAQNNTTVTAMLLHGIESVDFRDVPSDIVDRIFQITSRKRETGLHLLPHGESG